MSQYNKGNNQGYGNRPQYQGQQQPTSNQTPAQQPRINFGMIQHLGWNNSLR